MSDLAELLRHNTSVVENVLHSVGVIAEKQAEQGVVIDVIKKDIDVIKEDMAVIKLDQGVMRKDIRVLKTDVAVLETRMTGVENRLTGIEGHLEMNGTVRRKPRKR